MCVVLTFCPKETVYVDLMEKNPYRSLQGNQYIMSMYDYDANMIDVEPVKI